jgi:hypothetical protein
MNKLRVLYILHHFPQISETYIRSELEALRDECDIKVVSLSRADFAYRNHLPFALTDDTEEIERIIDEFRPDVLHSHWLQQARILARFAGFFGQTKLNIPFTIRSHSFDVLENDGAFIRQAAAAIDSDLCLGVLAFPFARPHLEKFGVRPDKIHDCYPVVDYRRFHDESPNGDAVMNVGACLPKKQMRDYLELASAFPQRRFDLYALGYQTPEITRLNTQRGNSVAIVPPVEPDEMPREYKRHEWLVYTASRKMNSVGWPLAVAEAQAAGVGVCLPNIRPDLGDYLGGAGFLYDSISEVADVLRRPYPEEMRQRGFEHARKSDIWQHKKTLTDLWAKAQSPAAAWRRFAPAAGGADAWGPGTTLLEKRERLRRARQELCDLIPTGDSYILVDEQALGVDFVPGRPVMPYLHRDGQYWGPPENDDAAVQEVERLRQAGARFLAFAWPAFWWLDHYAGLSRHLHTHFPPILKNERLAVFDLRGTART